VLTGHRCRFIQVRREISCHADWLESEGCRATSGLVKVPSLFLLPWTIAVTRKGQQRRD
jgi:hypothetical protein